MSMADRPRMSDEELADLVAYLDGELDAEAAQQMEAKLSLDPAARAEADALERSFNLLEYLPQPEPSPNFTHRTVEKLAAVRPASTMVSTGTSGRWRIPALAACWAAALFVAATLGFSGARSKAPRPQPVPSEPAELDQQLVRDLRVIENKRLYDLADDVDFVKALAEPDLFGEDG